MPPDKCGFCHDMIKITEQSVECIGPCEKYYHLSCANINPAELKYFVEDGGSRYKCYNCRRRRNDDVFITPNAKSNLHNPFFMNDSDTESYKELIEMLAAIKESGDLATDLIKQLAFELKELSGEMNMLRREHAQLKKYFKERLQSTASATIGNGTHDISKEPTLNYGEELQLKILHTTVTPPRSEIQSSKLNSPQKVLKMKVDMIAMKDAASKECKLRDSDKVVDAPAGKRSKLIPFGLILSVLFAALFYDIQKYGSFRSSSTGRFLNDFGALQFSASLWENTVHHYNLTCCWAMENIPYYYQVTRMFANPYLELMWNLFLMLGYQLQLAYEFMRDLSIEKVLLFIDWLSELLLFTSDWINFYFIVFWETVKEKALFFGNSVLKSFTLV